jgi:hypothetical protein
VILNCSFNSLQKRIIDTTTVCKGVLGGEMAMIQLLADNHQQRCDINIPNFKLSFMGLKVFLKTCSNFSNDDNKRLKKSTWKTENFITCKIFPVKVKPSKLNWIMFLPLYLSRACFSAAAYYTPSNNFL